MNIRKATNQDIESIISLSQQMMEFYCSLDEIHCAQHEIENDESFYQDQLQREDRLFVVAENSEGQIVGFGSAMIDTSAEMGTPLIGTLLTSFVLESYRGQGVGTELHNVRMQWLQEHGAEYVEMTVDVANTHALYLWKQKGFEEKQIILRKKI